MKTDVALLCECGCGTSIPSHDARGRPRRFVHGHAGGPLVGHEVTAETREKIAATKRGSRNPAWKGDRAGYNAIHKWLFTYYEKSGICEECETEAKTEWANVSGEYKRDRADFLELCISCHRRADIARPKRPAHLRIGEKDAS